MDLLEESGHVCMVGKVNMDRNCPEYLCEQDATASAKSTHKWLRETVGKYNNITPILTPRFIPSCTDELMHELAKIQKEFNLPVQSHLSENHAEIEWVKKLCPTSKSYSEAYDSFGLFGGDVPTIMAHCVWLEESEMELIKKRNVYVAHCPQSNINLTSGIAPIRKFMERGMSVGLGSDIAGGCHTSIFRAMSDAIQVSKLHHRYIDHNDMPLTVNEAFYLGTQGGGSFYGKAGSFEAEHEFDALIIDDTPLTPPFQLSIEERLARVIYLSDNSHIQSKFVRGKKIR